MNLRAEEQMSQEGRVEDQKEGTEDPALSFLLQGERLDSLDRKGYRIIQDPQRFCFGMDAVLLSAFADRKSTRLNSSHANISYAVFCLKKKKTLFKVVR